MGVVGRDDAAPAHVPTQVCREVGAKRQFEGSAVILVQTDQHLLLESGKLRDRPRHFAELNVGVPTGFRHFAHSTLGLLLRF